MLRNGMNDRIVRANLMDIVTTYCRATGRSLAWASKHFYGSADFFVKFKRGKQSITLDTAREMVTMFRNEWPAGVDWPPVRMISMGRYPQE
jgi:hypothetical protein